MIAAGIRLCTEILNGESLQTVKRFDRIFSPHLFRCDEVAENAIALAFSTFIP